MITIIIPEWLVIVIGFCFMLVAINSTLNIYLLYLQNKLEEIKSTTTSTVDYVIKKEEDSL